MGHKSFEFLRLQTLGVELLEYGQLFRAREHTTLIAQAIGPHRVLGRHGFGENEQWKKYHVNIQDGLPKL